MEKQVKKVGKIVFKTILWGIFMGILCSQQFKPKHIVAIYIRYFNWGIDNRSSFRSTDIFKNDGINLYHLTITNRRTLRKVERALKSLALLEKTDKIYYDFRLLAQISWSDGTKDTLLIDKWHYIMYKKMSYHKNKKFKKIIYDPFNPFDYAVEPTLKLKYRNKEVIENFEHKAVEKIGNGEGKRQSHRGRNYKVKTITSIKEDK